MEALSLENMSEDIFQCGRCKVAFTSLAMFLSHKREPCAPPNWTIAPANECVSDMATYDPQPQLCITTCGARFNVPESYDDRRLYTTPSASHRGASVPAEQSFTTPPETDEPLPVTCIQCRKTFKKLTNLSVHLKTHVGEKGFQCPVCGRCFSQNVHLQRHLQRHRVWPDGLGNTVPAASDAAPSSYACSYCGLILPDYNKFRIHLKSHISKKLFKCIQGACLQLFDELELLMRHVQDAHRHPTYSCHLCEYSTGSLEELSTHQQNHLRNADNLKIKKKYSCLHCDASFGKLEKLTFHSATHSHLRTCTRCNKAFSSEKRLRSHLRTHDDARPFHCNVCGASFRLKKYLTTHILRHGERSHACLLCNLRFKRKDLLDRHRKIHQPRKKLECPFKEQLGCGMQFSRSDKMKLHIKSHVKRITSNNVKSRKRGPDKAGTSTMEIVIIPVKKDPKV